jgi:hypothetical protein
MADAPFRPDVAKWDTWHPAEVARRLAEVDVWWYVAAGWALDLFHGRQRRPHDDIEIAVPERAFGAIREAFAEFELFAIGAGYAHPLDDRSLAQHHQTWVREPATGTWRVDVMREPWDGDTWVCRRDARIRLPAARVIAHTADGIPYARPEIVLLFKAKATREKDQADFDGVLPLLEPDQRGWLAHALELIHPGHRWLSALADRRAPSAPDG